MYKRNLFEVVACHSGVLLEGKCQLLPRTCGMVLKEMMPMCSSCEALMGTLCIFDK